MHNDIESRWPFIVIGAVTAGIVFVLLCFYLLSPSVYNDALRDGEAASVFITAVYGVLMIFCFIGAFYPPKDPPLA